MRQLTITLLAILALSCSKDPIIPFDDIIQREFVETITFKVSADDYILAPGYLPVAHYEFEETYWRLDWYKGSAGEVTQYEIAQVIIDGWEAFPSQWYYPNLKTGDGYWPLKDDIGNRGYNLWGITIVNADSKPVTVQVVITRTITKYHVPQG